MDIYDRQRRSSCDSVHGKSPFRSFVEKYHRYRRRHVYYWSELFYPDANISARGYSSLGLSRPKLGEDFLRSVHPYLSLLHQNLGDSINFFADGPDRRRDVARMERHVPALNAFRRQRPEGREVLRQPHRGDHLREFLGRLHPEQADVGLRGRMDRGGAADQADRHRQLDRPDKISVTVLLPRREGAVPAGLPCRVRVGPGLDGPPVVPGGHDDRIDPVHDSLVVRRAPERIRIRERVRLQDALDDVLSGDVVGPNGLFREDGAGANEAPHREVRDDPEVDAAARPFLDVRRDRLRHRVHRVRPHRVAAVDDQVGDYHVSPFRVHDPDLDVLRAAADLHEHRVLLVRDREDLVSVVEDRHPRPVGVRDPDELDLPDHDWTRGARREPAPLPGHPSRVRGRRDDARLLDRHRDQVITLVDPEVHGDPEGDRHRADHVLDHSVDLVELQRPRVPDRLDLRVRELSERSDDLPAIFGALLVETRNLRTLHGGTERRRRLSVHKGIARRLTLRGGSRSSRRTRSRPRLASRSWCRSDPSLRREASPRPPVGEEAWRRVPWISIGSRVRGYIGGRAFVTCPPSAIMRMTPTIRRGMPMQRNGKQDSDDRQGDADDEQQGARGQLGQTSLPPVDSTNSRIMI